MAAEDLDARQNQQTPNRFWMILAGAAVVSMLFAVWLKSANIGRHSGLPAGSETPPLEAAGWINGDPPATLPPEGKVRLLHAWFTTCPACYRETPLLVRLHKEYADKGVEFVGLTYEPADRLREIQEYLSSTDITWVNGYGGSATLEKFGVNYFPSAWIIDAEGTVLWNMDSEIPLEKALALSAEGKLSPPVSSP